VCDLSPLYRANTRSKLRLHFPYSSFYTRRNTSLCCLFQWLPFYHVVSHLHTGPDGVCQYSLSVSLNEWKHQTTKNSTQNASETVTVLKPVAGIYRYFPTVLFVVIFFVQVASSVAAVHLSLHLLE